MVDFVLFVSAFITGHLVCRYQKAYNGFGLEIMLSMTGFWANLKDKSDGLKFTWQLQHLSDQ